MAIKKADRTLARILIEDGHLPEETVVKVLEEVEVSGRGLREVLLDSRTASPEQVALALGKQHGIPYLPLAEYEIDPDVINLIDEDTARKFRMFPVDGSVHDKTLTVALADPANIFLLDNIRRSTGMEIIPLLSLDHDIEEAINRYYLNDLNALQDLMKDLGDAEEAEIVQSEEEDEDFDPELEAPVIKLVNLIVTEAIKANASDIHLEPGERDIRLRYRIDGVLKEMPPPPKKLQNAIVSRIKIMAELDIAEKRKPQDGRFKMAVSGKKVDFRISVLPTVFGEKVVMRLLDKSNLNLDLMVLGFEPEQLDLFEHAIRAPYGQILVTGPTGSGKSTTLYSALSTINDPEVNIVTVEDPVEYQIKGINQVHARPEIGLTFANALRSILRQDPDIVMIGEIRDLETAEIAIKAALTGHLVLSTLHTNDAPTTITRLGDMGVEHFLISASVILVVAQRLVRRICPRCREEYAASEKEIIELGLDATEHKNVKFAHGTGCSHCSDTGYKGRIAVHEVMYITEHLGEMIARGAPTTELRRTAIEEGMMTLRRNGIRKVLSHVTTPAEVLRVSVAD